MRLYDIATLLYDIREWLNKKKKSMKGNKIVLSYKRLNDSQLVQKAGLILECLTDNKDFPNPSPTLEELNLALVEFNSAILSAKEGWKAEQWKRIEKRKQLIELLDSLAWFVQHKGNRNEESLMSTGISLRKTPQPVGVLPNPQAFTIVATNVGTIKMKLKAIYGARSYQYEYRKKGESTWQVFVHTKAVLLLSNLESGAMYEFRVAGIGTNTQRVISDVLSSYVL